MNEEFLARLPSSTIESLHASVCWLRQTDEYFLSALKRARAKGDGEAERPQTGIRGEKFNKQPIRSDYYKAPFLL